MTIWVGTDEGLLGLDGGPALLPGLPITAVSGAWALVGGDRLVAIESGVEVKLETPPAWCLLDTGDRVHVGTAEARLFTVIPDAGAVSAIESFDEIPTRDGWYTPWGAPPDVRSLAAGGSDGTLLVNVHVGGVWRDTGDSWDEVIEVDSDTHQIVAAVDVVVAAAAVGFGRSLDAGCTWEWTAEGLHGSYSRAVAIAGATVLLTASTGPGSKQGAIYRRPLRGDGPMTRCESGLPEWFPFNLDTGQLAASADEAVLGTADGRVFRSVDEGATWELIAEGLASVRTVTIS